MTSGTNQRAVANPGLLLFAPRIANFVYQFFLPVCELAESFRRVREEGGEVLKEMRQKNGEYAYAAVRDPVGAHLALVPGK